MVLLVVKDTIHGHAAPMQHCEPERSINVRKDENQCILFYKVVRNRRLRVVESEKDIEPADDY